MSAKDAIKMEFEAAEDKVAYVNDLRRWIHMEISPFKSQPVDLVEWVPYTSVQANDYNPNSVAKNEMRLLHTSISHDGYTQPVVTIDHPEKFKEIVDGFHRRTIMEVYADISESTNSFLPVVTIDKPINDRMASTVRHNRARGKHSVDGMAGMVFSMLEEGWKDEEICNQLGMEADELIRLKHVTGFSKLFEDVEYKKAWETRAQIVARKKWEAEEAEKKSN